MKKILFVFTICLLISCGPAWQAKKLAYMDITDAEGFFVASSATAARGGAPVEVLMKETASGEIKAVEYSDENGNPVSFELYLHRLEELGSSGNLFMSYDYYPIPNNGRGPADNPPIPYSLMNFITQKESGKVFCFTSNKELNSQIGSPPTSTAGPVGRPVASVGDKCYILGSPNPFSMDPLDYGIWVADLTKETLAKAKIPQEMLEQISGFVVTNKEEIVYKVYSSGKSFLLQSDGYVTEVPSFQYIEKSGRIFSYKRTGGYNNHQSTSSYADGVYEFISNADKEFDGTKIADALPQRVLQYFEDVTYAGVILDGYSQDNESIKVVTVERSHLVYESFNFITQEAIEKSFPLQLDGTLDQSLRHDEFVFLITAKSVYKYLLSDGSFEQWEMPSLLTRDKVYINAAGNVMISGMDNYSEYKLYEVSAKGATVKQTEGWDPKTMRLLRLQ